MKKFVFIMLLLISAVVTSQAQNATFVMPKESTYINITTDYVLTSTTAKWILLKGEKDWIGTYDFQFAVDSTSGNHTNVAVSLWGRKFSGDAWTQIGSTSNIDGATLVPTTISSTSGARWREFKFNFVGTGTGVSTVSDIKFKIWFQ